MPIANTSYIKDDPRCSGPIFFKDEIYSWYLNTEKPISDPDFANFILCIRELGSTDFVLQNIGQLDRDIFPYDFYKIKCKFAFPDVKYGWYELVIYDHINDVIKAVSNPIQVEERELVKSATRVFYRHDENIDGYEYEYDEDFWNIFTVPLIQTDFGFLNERKTYRNDSDDKIRNYNIRKDEVFKIEAYLVDEDMHRAMSAMFDDHNMVFINYTSVTPQAPYSVASQALSVLRKGTVEVIADHSKVNPNADLITPNPGDALLIYAILTEDRIQIDAETGEGLILEYP